MAFSHLATVLTLLIFPCISGYQSEDGNHGDISRELYEELKHELGNMRADLEEVNMIVSYLDERIIDDEETAVQSTAGTGVYVRWGRSVCPGDAVRIYGGTMGGADSTDQGSGSNYLCLPLDPIYENHTDTSTSSRGEIWGTEYAGEPDLIFDPANRDGPTFVDQDVPCAMCHVVNRSSILMVPARNVCPDGWTTEYYGYIMSAAKSASGPKPYECIDHQPETLMGGSEAEQSASLYNVQARCGTLLCPNYVDGWELTCAVCSK